MVTHTNTTPRTISGEHCPVSESRIPAHLTQGTIPSQAQPSKAPMGRKQGLCSCGHTELSSAGTRKPKKNASNINVPAISMFQQYQIFFNILPRKQRTALEILGMETLETWKDPWSCFRSCPGTGFTPREAQLHHAAPSSSQ